MNKSVNKELKKLYEQDQKERETTNWDSVEEVQLLNEQDIKRQAYALYLVENGMLVSSQDYYHAAMLFHHSDSVQTLGLAVALSEVSMNMENADGRWLYARALDRFLLKVGQAQKFGTQFEQKNGTWGLCNYDKSTTDEERAFFDVPTVEYQLKVKCSELNTK